MAARLTQESLLTDISTKYKTIEFGFCKDKQKTTDQIFRKAEHLYDNFIDVQVEFSEIETKFDENIDIQVEVAKNEKKPYTSSEIGFKTVDMRLKDKTGERQTADYVPYWKFKNEGKDQFKKLGIIFERKAVEDFHNTIIHGYKTFNNEINRFLGDPTTKYMFILVEGSRDEALTYLPPIRRYPGDQVRNLIAAKIGAVASIETRGVHVCWQGSRKSSANSIKGYIKHFFCKNCAGVLDI
jgi:hypothetical protein